MNHVTDNILDPRIIEILERGGVGFMPSDTIYGLSCLALNRGGVEQLHKLKDRDQHKPFIVLISSIKMLDLLSIDQEQVDLAKKYWPGPLTFIFRAPATPEWLQLGSGTLAVRIPNYPDLQALIEAIGPIISTSANLQGGKPAVTAAQAQKYFGDQLDFYIDAGELKGQPSTLVKAVNGKLQVLRQGAVTIDNQE